MLRRLEALRDEQQSGHSVGGFCRPFAGIGNDFRKNSSGSNLEQQSALEEKRKHENGENSQPAKKLRTDVVDAINKENASPVARMFLSSSKFGPPIPQTEISGEFLFLNFLFLHCL